MPIEKMILPTTSSTLPLQILITEDGSATLFSEQYQEIYHSRQGALSESLHVFIQYGLKAYLQQAAHKPTDNTPLQLLEVGWGTGLNSLLALAEAAAQQLPLFYTAIEPQPLSWEIVKQLQYPQIARLETFEPFFEAMHQAPWEEIAPIHPTTSILKKKAALEKVELPQKSYNLIFMDAFAPAHHPVLWEMPVLQKLHDVLQPGGLLITYCARGQFKRDLKSLGFEVENPPGPGKKRQMTQAWKH